MVGVRALQARVAKLERGRRIGSPYAEAFGSFAAFEAWADEQVAAGQLDPRDFPVVVMCLRQWERDGTWGGAARERTCTTGLQ